MTNELGIYTSENNRLVVSSRKVATGKGQTHLINYYTRKKDN